VENLDHSQQILCALSSTGYASTSFQAFHLVLVANHQDLDSAHFPRSMHRDLSPSVLDSDQIHWCQRFLHFILLIFNNLIFGKIWKNVKKCEKMWKNVKNLRKCEKFGNIRKNVKYLEMHGCLKGNSHFVSFFSFFARISAWARRQYAPASHSPFLKMLLHHFSEAI
jgi:hypothetical protein